MDSVNRLLLVARVSYYVAWISAACGAAVHFSLGVKIAGSMQITPRNFLEGSLLFFLISAVSALRAGVGRFMREPVR
jgi:hypothetical protein